MAAGADGLVVAGEGSGSCMPWKIPVTKEASVLGNTLVRVVPFDALAERVTLGIVAIAMAVLSIVSTGNGKGWKRAYMLLNWLEGLSTCPMKSMSFIIIGAALRFSDAGTRRTQPLDFNVSLLALSAFCWAIMAPGYATPILISVCFTPTQAPVIAPT